MADDRDDNIAARIEAASKLIIFGQDIKAKRQKRDLSLRDLANALGVSAHYLSELERGVKNPSDHMVRLIADYFGSDENTGFETLGRVPLLAREEVESNRTLQKTLSEIRQNPRLTDEQKGELYHKIYELYHDFVTNIDEEEDDEPE